MPKKAKGGKKAEPKRGKVKKVKEKDAPKRAMSAFFCYQKTRREALTKENPSMDNKKIVSKMAEEWRCLDAKGREPYEKMAEKEKERYEREMQEYEEKKKHPKAAEPAKEAAKAEPAKPAEAPKAPEAEKKEEGKVSGKKSAEKKP